MLVNSLDSGALTFNSVTLKEKVAYITPFLTALGLVILGGIAEYLGSTDSALFYGSFDSMVISVLGKLLFLMPVVGLVISVKLLKVGLGDTHKQAFSFATNTLMIIVGLFIFL